MRWLSEVFVGNSVVRRTVLRMPKAQRQRVSQVSLPIVDDDGLPRLPATRAECPELEQVLDALGEPLFDELGNPVMRRNCPFVSCRHHLYLDVNPITGSIKLNFADLEPDELTEACSLDVAERGGSDLEAIGSLLGLVRERIRQIEAKALRNLRARLDDEDDED